MKKGAQNVVVETIQPAKKEGFSSLRLRVTEETKNITSVLLGGKGFSKSVVGFQTISNEQLEALGIKVGADIGKATSSEVRLTITEINEAQFKALPVDRESGKGWMCQKAFQAKVLPADATKNRLEDVMITSGGYQVYRNVSLTDATSADTLLPSDKVLSAIEEVAVENGMAK